MKCFYFITIFVLVHSFTVCGQALTGDKTIGAGTGKNYNSIAAAIADLNLKGVGTGGVTFLVDAGHVETFADETYGKITTTGTSDNPIIFKKSGAGNNPIISTELNISFKAVITISGGDYITFDGIDIIENEGNTYGSIISAYKIEANENDGACNNAIKKCKITLRSDGSDHFAIFQSSTEVNSGKNNNNIYSNINITEASVAIYLEGYSAASYSDNCLIENCTIGSESDFKIRSCGIKISNCGSIIICNNIIKNIIDLEYYCYGIRYENPPDSKYTIYTLKIYNNKITGINSADNNYASIGISINNYNDIQNNCYVYNNMISNLIKTNTIATTSYLIKGIELLGGSTNNFIYHNSVLINSTEYPSSRCISLDAGKNTIYNNLFITTSSYSSISKRYFLFCNSSSNLVNSDYNNYHFLSSGSNNIFGRVNTTNYSSLQDWITNLNKDIHSISQQVYFKSTTDLHLDGTSIGNLDLAGKDLSSLGLPGYDKDIDGENRNISNPYMGADEDPTHPVPVEMATFEASKCANFISLYWNTKTELNCIQFDIERRCEDESCWTYIATVPGHGNSYNFNEYSFIDNYSIGNKTQYRLKQIDNDGEYKYYYSNILDAELINNYELYGNYPNPFNPSTTISYNLQNEGEVIIKIYSISGELIQTNKEGMKSKGYNETKIDLNNYPSGIYLYQLEVFGINNLKIFDALKKMILVK